jgi:hypothetical protein
MAIKRRRYVGELATAIIRPDPPTFEGAVTPERVDRFWHDYDAYESKTERLIEKKLSQKMMLLMEHYGISDPKDFAALALALAFAHVPGFKIVPEVKAKTGRRRKWDGPRLLELLTTVNRLKSQHRLKEKQALTFMVNNQQYRVIWGPPPRHRGTKQQWIETLESRLQDAKRYARRIEILRSIGRDTDLDTLQEKFRKW